MLNIVTEHAPSGNRRASSLDSFKARLGSVIAEARMSSEMISETWTITPEQAQYILDNHNTGNRPFSIAKAKAYAALMEEGRFRTTSQGISFDDDGKLNNGQHRLGGCAISGVPIRVYVTFGEPSDNFVVLDSGGIRTNSDVLAIKGLAYHTIIAAGCRLVFQIENDVNLGRQRRGRISADMFMPIIDGEHGPLMQQAGRDAAAVSQKLKCGSGPICAALFFILRDSRYQSPLTCYDTFVSQLVTGANLPNGPVLKLRDGLTKKTLDAGFRGQEQRAVAQTAAIILAWNNVMRGRRGSIIWDGSVPLPKPE